MNNKEKSNNDFARKSDIADLRSEMKGMKDEIIRHFDVKVEEMDKKWDLVAEQYLGVTKGLDIVAREVAIVKEQVQLINVNLTVGLPRRRKGFAS